MELWTCDLLVMEQVLWFTCNWQDQNDVRDSAWVTLTSTLTSVFNFSLVWKPRCVVPGSLHGPQSSNMAKCLWNSKMDPDGISRPTSKCSQIVSIIFETLKLLFVFRLCDRKKTEFTEVIGVKLHMSNRPPFLPPPHLPPPPPLVSGSRTKRSKANEWTHSNFNSFGILWIGGEERWIGWSWKYPKKNPQELKEAEEG